MEKKGKVYLVGAGAGAKGQLTLRGAECLKKADVVVYDLLANMSVLNLTSPECELICAGKRAGNHIKKQSETNLLLAEKALSGKNVVRLKGGDPFVFGRGGEEAEILRKYDVEFEIVSGVSSCFSVPAFAGIPVTHREYASSFHVVTGHRQTSENQIDYSVLAKSEGTLVFLMSLGNLEEIAEKLIFYGKNPDTPSAVIQQGTTPYQRTVTASLSTIAQEVRKNNISTPAITVIGDVVKLHQKLEWFKKGVLADKKVLLTGTSEHISRLAECLEIYGADTVETSLVYIEKNNNISLKSAEFQNFEWIVFTSPNGVKIFFEQLNKEYIDLRKLLHLKFAAIGRGTSAELKKAGIFADCIPEKYESGYLADTLIKHLKDNERVLLIQAENGTDTLEKKLAENKTSFKKIPLYRTKTAWNRAETLNISLSDADYIVFSSSSAVQAYTKMKKNDFYTKAKAVAIGAITAKSAITAGINYVLTAETASAEGITECILNDVLKRMERK